MEKTIQITIGSTQFHLTEAAYEALQAYLDSLKVHFATQADSAEILQDIEARIAEKLLEEKAAVYSVSDITRVIGEIGNAEQFDDAPEEASAVAGPKKLYRDVDNAMIAGVAAGIAHYFGIDALWVRLIFIASVFFGGTGIILYILLALLIPAAKTASQKLEMQGAAVTLEAIARTVRERVEEATEKGAFQRLGAALHTVIGKVFSILGTIVGAAVSVGSLFAILGVTAAFAVLLANWDTAYVSQVIRDVVSPTMLALSLVAGYLVAIIPLVFILALGVRLIRGRGTLPTAIGFGLLGLWFIAIPVTGALATRIVGDYYTLVESHPEYRDMVEERTLPTFLSVSVDGARVVIREGAEQSVSVEGTGSSIAAVTTTVEDGVLTVRTDMPEDTCVIFCRRVTPTTIITTPDLATIESDGGRISFDGLTTEDLALRIEQSSVYGSVDAERLTIEAEGSNVRMNVQSSVLSLDALSSSMDFDGDAARADITLVRSHLGASSLILESARVDAIRSSARLFVEDSLEVVEDDASFVANDGRAELIR
jgi:phage shock protein PspC (stress-responsive transcriptional regulator)